ncbi:MAG: hypothetical protein LBR74_03460 [Eubacterium sp.]|jgi:hypothetical protein|nr:hypothetical protein [Eubacterium sp.]
MDYLMRERLCELDGYLFNKFEESLKIAQLEWLPAIAPSGGSYNSLPHVLNVEKKVGDILFEPKNIAYHKLDLSAAELYILLCAIFLHDIGRIDDKTKDHAKQSKELILESWAQIRIASEAFARMIAVVAFYHDCKSGGICAKEECEGCPENNERRSIRSVDYIEHYGNIRVKMLASLLFLGDHLDGAKNRVEPKYISKPDPSKIKRDIRIKISDHITDIEKNMIYSAIDADNKEDFKKTIDNIIDKNKKNAAVKIDINNPDNQEHYLKIIKGVCRNNKDLGVIRNSLIQAGIPIKEWLIECDGHLYRVELANNKHQISEHFEPVLDADFLYKVLKSMLKLQQAVIMKEKHSYEQLLNLLKEPRENLSRVKTAVKRLQILFEDTPSRVYNRFKLILNKGNVKDRDNIIKRYEIYWDDKFWSISDIND